MNILQLIDVAEIGGAENHTRLISRAFLKIGCGITLVCPQGIYLEKYRSLLDDGAKVEVLDTSREGFLSPFQLRRSLRKIKEIILRDNIDAIHSHMHGADLVAVLAAKGLDKKVLNLSTIHYMMRMDLEGKRMSEIVRYPLVRYALGKMDRIFTVSEYVAHETGNYFNLPREKIVTVLNGIDLSEIQVAVDRLRTRKELKLSADDRVICCVGVINHRKGQYFLVKALKALVQDGYSDLKLILIGRGETQDDEVRLKALAQELGISSRITFLGYRDDVADILAASDVYAQPSLWDPLPRALMEAMGLGLAVVASSVSGIPEIISDGDNGLLHPPGDEVRLKGQLARLLTDREYAQTLGDKARKFIHENCTTIMMVEKMLAEIEELSTLFNMKRVGGNVEI